MSLNKNFKQEFKILYFNEYHFYIIFVSLIQMIKFIKLMPDMDAGIT